MTVSGTSTGRMEIYRFYAPIGNYKIKLINRNPNDFEKVTTNLIPIKTTDLSNYFIEIREGKETLFLVYGIIMTLFGLFLAVGGLVLGLTIKQIIH